MKVLVVDDDPNKVKQLRECVSDLLPQAEVVHRRSYQSGLKAALFERPDIIVLDMTMPTYDVGGKETGGRERRYAGQQILRQLKRKMAESRAVVVTQFEQFGEGDQLVTLEELSRNLTQEFGEYFLGTVFYQAGDTHWREVMKQLLERSGFRAVEESER
jgi:CheY-like chemotaxis protein